MKGLDHAKIHFIDDGSDLDGVMEIAYAAFTHNLTTQPYNAGLIRVFAWMSVSAWSIDVIATTNTKKQYGAQDIPYTLF